jgi:hypothetical protein
MGRRLLDIKPGKEWVMRFRRFCACVDDKAQPYAGPRIKKREALAR